MTREHPALANARRALKLEQRAPTDADRPPASTFPGRKGRRLPGQLELLEPEIAARQATARASSD
jgi:hypothetical protein